MARGGWRKTYSAFYFPLVRSWARKQAVGPTVSKTPGWVYRETAVSPEVAFWRKSALLPLHRSQPRIDDNALVGEVPLDDSLAVVVVANDQKGFSRCAQIRQLRMVCHIAAARIYPLVPVVAVKAV